jgi:hypothetical protein
VREARARDARAYDLLVTDLRLTLLDQNDEPVWSYALPVDTALAHWAGLEEDVRAALEGASPDDEA